MTDQVTLPWPVICATLPGESHKKSVPAGARKRAAVKPAPDSRYFNTCSNRF